MTLHLTAPALEALHSDWIDNEKTEQLESLFCCEIDKTKGSWSGLDQSGRELTEYFIDFFPIWLALGIQLRQGRQSSLPVGSRYFLAWLRKE